MSCAGMRRRDWLEYYACYEMLRCTLWNTRVYAYAYAYKLNFFAFYFWPCQRSRSWPIFCRVCTLDLDSVLVKTRRISIRPFKSKSYKGNGQTDRRHWHSHKRYLEVALNKEQACRKVFYSSFPRIQIKEKTYRSCCGKTNDSFDSAMISCTKMSPPNPEWNL